MPFIPRKERPSLALLAGIEEKQASEISDALSTATDKLDDEQLVQYVIDRTPSIEARDVKRILEAVRQIASAREVLEAQPEVFLNDIAEEMGAIEEKDLRLDGSEQRRLRDRLIAITEYAQYTDRVTASAGDLPELRRRFEKYAEEWKTQTAHLSVLSQRIMHPSYQRIIGLGRDALPLIIERLSTHPDHWFWALRSISGEDPVRREEEGRFGAMRDAWIRWGRNRGLI